MKLKEMKLTSFLQRMILLMLFIPVTVMAQDNGTDRGTPPSPYSLHA